MVGNKLHNTKRGHRTLWPRLHSEQNNYVFAPLTSAMISRCYFVLTFLHTLIVYLLHNYDYEISDTVRVYALSVFREFGAFYVTV